MPEPKTKEPKTKEPKTKEPKKTKGGIKIVQKRGSEDYEMREAAMKAVLEYHNIKFDLDSLSFEGWERDDEGNWSGDLQYNPAPGVQSKPAVKNTPNQTLTKGEIRQMSREERKERAAEISEFLKGQIDGDH